MGVKQPGTLVVSSLFSQIRESLQRLHRSVQSLEQYCQLLHLAPLSKRSWWQLLEYKLLPQAGRDAFLVVAVVGGTNTGKSAVFNHLAGYCASAVGPLAAGTRHPVCLIPEGFLNSHRLEDIFPGFELRRWTSAEQATQDCSTDLLFWDVAPQLPPRLVVLDTPDIDSDVRVNWRRAERIWRCSDVLIAILTPQKYNDAAVKRFFREAAAENKAVLVVFNQCPDSDAPFWPRWLETFCSETGVQPELVYLVLFDRKAADENRLSFTLCQAAPEHSGRKPAGLGEGVSLRDDLAQLRFDELRLRTLAGALQRLLDQRDGAPSTLAELKARSAEFRKATNDLQPERLAELEAWPTIPRGVLARGVRRWWSEQRHGWSARVHAVYDQLAGVVRLPRLRRKKNARHVDLLAEYRQREWDAMVLILEQMFDRLEQIGQTASEPLRQTLSGVLSGSARAELLDQLAQQHAQADLKRELDEVVSEVMDDFREESPGVFKLLRLLDSIAAAARVTVSVGLFAAGVGPIGHFVVSNLAGSSASVLVKAAAGVIVAVGGERVVSTGVGAGAGYIEAKVQGLYEAFARRRAAWLLGVVEASRLGCVLQQLHEAAAVPATEAFREAERATKELAQMLAQLRSGSAA